MENMTRTWLPGGRPRQTKVSVDRYKERNHGQYLLSISIGIFLLVLEVILIILAAPGKRVFTVPSNRAIHLEIKAPEKPTLLRYSRIPCFSSEKISGINLQSEGEWSLCAPSMVGDPDDKKGFPKGFGFYAVSFISKRIFRGIYHWQNTSDTMTIECKVMVDETMEGWVEFAGTDLEERYIDALETNLRMLSNITNVFVIEKTKPVFASEKVGNVTINSTVAGLLLNISNAKIPTPMNTYRQLEPEFAAMHVLYEAGHALFNFRKPGPDTPSLQVWDVYGNRTQEDLKEPLVLGYYNGPIVTTLGSVILVLISFFVYIITILMYRSPGNLAWEVISSHGRLYGDVLLSGPNRILEWCSAVDCDNMSNVDHGGTGCALKEGLVLPAHQRGDYLSSI